MFDRTQNNLYNSIDEVLDSVKVDELNHKLIKCYLKDVTRCENLERFTRNESYLDIYDKVYPYNEFGREINRKIREEYADIDLDVLESEICSQIKRFKNYEEKDELDDVFKALFTQKLVISHSTCATAKISRVWTLMKNNPKLIKNQALTKSDTKDAYEYEVEEKRLQEIMTRRLVLKNTPDSSYRPYKDKICGVCECLLF